MWVCLCQMMWRVLTHCALSLLQCYDKCWLLSNKRAEIWNANSLNLLILHSTHKLNTSISWKHEWRRLLYEKNERTLIFVISGETVCYYWNNVRIVTQSGWSWVDLGSESEPFFTGSTLWILECCIDVQGRHCAQQCWLDSALGHWLRKVSLWIFLLSKSKMLHREGAQRGCQ